MKKWIMNKCQPFILAVICVSTAYYSSVVLAEDSASNATNKKNSVKHAKVVEECLDCHDRGFYNFSYITPLPLWYINKRLKQLGSATPNSPHALDSNERLVIANKIQSIEINLIDRSIVLGDKEVGKKLYQVCANCHGINGEGSRRMEAPPLAKQSKMYLLRSMRDYRLMKAKTDGLTPKAKVMVDMMKLISDRGIFDLVAYINELSIVRPPLKPLN